MVESRRVLSECDVLEEEFNVLFSPSAASGHDKPPARETQELPSPDSDDADERLKRLRERVQQLDQPLTALCLSGGGIRSATFCLGVLQALARATLQPLVHPQQGEGEKKPSPESQLEQFHYLSTVSGGGYIGSWLSRWIKEAGLAKVIEEMAGKNAPTAQAQESEPEPAPIRNLRAYSNYLAPRRGWSADTWSLIVLYIRNLLLNWLVLLPLLFAVLILPRLNLALLDLGSVSNPIRYGALAAALILLAISAALIALSIPSVGEERLKSVFLQKSCPWLICIAAWLLAWVYYHPAETFGYWGPAWLSSFVERFALSPPGMADFKDLLQVSLLVSGIAHLLAFVAISVYSTDASRNSWLPGMWDMLGFVVSMLSTALMFGIGMTLFSPLGNRALTATFAVPYVLFAYVIVGTVWVGATARLASEADREWWAASGGGAAALAVGWIGLHVLVFDVPGAVLRLGGMGAVALAGAGGLAGIATALVGYWSRRKWANDGGGKNRILGLLEKWGLQIGALLFLVLFLGVGGSLVSGYALAKLDNVGIKIQDSPAAENNYALTIKAVDQWLIGFGLDPQKLEPEVKKEVDEQRQRVVKAELSGLDDSLGRTLRDVDLRLRRGSQVYESGLSMTSPQRMSVILFLLILIAVGWSALIGVNRFSIHSLYANRLIRAYLGAPRPRPARKPDPLSGFDDGDNIPMSELPGGKRAAVKSAPVRLFHVVTAALNLVGQDRLEWQQRKASSFIISPLHAGSWMLDNASGEGYGAYQPVETYGGDNGIALGKAMAVSGAAVSPNMGYHSSSLVACVMTFFNARLGWWLPNPGKIGEKMWKKKEPRIGLPLLAQELFGKTTSRESFVYLSDGGHFDNLGLYEMVRRRCARIFLVDATADPDYRYEDLATTIRKIRADMGICVEFPPQSGPALQRPPKGPYTIGQIHYSDVDGDGAKDGLLIYLKPLLIGGEPVDVISYALDHYRNGDRFPHQSTADQFFDEAQFESYRMLGKYMATRVLEDIHHDLGGISYDKVPPYANTACEMTPQKNRPFTAGTYGGGGLRESPPCLPIEPPAN